jgi:D-tyrosyl-tRNA(Tyr) deacylase
VSQFTLLASTKKGAKPDFHGAANPEEARRLYHYFVQKVKAGYKEERVKDGQFQAWMEVALVNDGPVSFPLFQGMCMVNKRYRSPLSSRTVLRPSRIRCGIL